MNLPPPAPLQSAMNPAPPAHFRPARRPRFRLWAAVAALLALGAALSGCGDQNIKPNTFKIAPTTNTDFVQVSFATDDQPLGVAVADFNNDGLDDFAISNYLAHTIQIFTATGPAAFTSQTFPVDGFPIQIKAADLHGGGTGQADLVVLVEKDQFDYLAIFLNDGTAFTAQATIALGTVAEQMEVACLQNPCANGTANDIVVSLPDSQILRVFANDGTANFSQTDNGLGKNVGHFTIADLNGDGNLDVVAALPADNSIQVLLGAGNSGFYSSINYSSGDFPVRIVAAPLRTPGLIDLAVACYSSKTLSVFFGNGDGTFAGPFNTPIEQHAESLLVGNFGPEPSIVAAIRGITGHLWNLRGDGTGVFATGTLFTTAEPISLLAGNFTSDSNLDFVSAEHTDRILGVFAGDGAGNFSRTQIGFDTSVIQPTPIHACGGSKDDILLLEYRSDRVVLLCNQN